MNKQCFYKNIDCSCKMSREHIISAAVLKAVFGDPIKNSVKAEFLGDKYLFDHEQRIKDVCQNCNQKLSPYDIAGAELANVLHSFYDASAKTIPFNSNILGWIIKTHLNHMRIIKDRETDQIYPIDHTLKQSLINFKPLPQNKFILLYDAMQGEEYFWDAESPNKINYFSYRSVRLIKQCIVISDFRFKTFTTWFVIPSDTNYDSFEDRANSALREVKEDFGYELEQIDINCSVTSNFLELRKVIPLSIIKKMIKKD